MILLIKLFLIKLIFITYVSFGLSQEKSSKDIQGEIDSRNNQINLIKKEVSKLERQIIEKTKKEIAASEIIIDLKNKINLTEKLISSIDRERRLIQKKINQHQIEVENKEAQAEIIKNRLKKNIIYSYKNGRPTFLESLLNTTSYNDILYKTKYLQIINKYEKKNRDELKNLITEIISNNKILKKQLEDKKKLKNKNLNQQQTLKKDIKKKNQLLKKISKEKEQEQTSLNKKRNSLKEIENIIAKLYLDKNAQKKREERLAEIRKIQKIATNGNFNLMKGKLPWPAKGTIISSFGNKKNKKLNTITENLGIDIKTTKNEDIIAILDGVVSTITYIRGHGNIIILDHGDGFNTVYANVENIIINENDYVKAGKKIANVNDDMILHFEIWANQKKLNPEKWLIK